MRGLEQDLTSIQLFWQLLLPPPVKQTTDALIVNRIVESGKVIDVKVKSSYCKHKKWEDPKKGPQYEDWMEKYAPLCTANHQGSAASMECCGLQDIFNRSERKYNVKYVEYIGDGDTKSFKTVHESMSYGPQVDIQKVECVGHVRKEWAPDLEIKKKKVKKKIS
ncbi:hypothetical protein ANN_14662 [Periplaneta americana]|uniref:Mutator-like transposase domain-containing protein n=1 Tax=Periplaneta americana TaxID=6978 RepID=A0ABQ8SWY2_PERAM|nr:hypothetical protein ANN_14662 [Periplaneta americana]